MRNQTRRKCVQLLQKAQNNGDLRGAKRIMAIFAVADGTLYSTIATTLKVSEESIRLWVNAFLLYGVKSFIYKKTNRQTIKTKQKTKETAGSTDQPGATKIRISWRLLAQPHDTVVDL